VRNYNYREMLINSTISVIANEGLDKTTTKAIVAGTDISESYIYRFFADKEDLLAKTFDVLDNELVSEAMAHISIMYIEKMEYEARCWMFYSFMWRFVLSNREKCLAFIRYYYSPYFQKYSAKEHKKRYTPLVAKFEDAFKPEANTWMLLNHVLNVMLDFAIKVYNGDVANDDDTAEHVFRLVYNSIKPYFKEKERAV